MRQYSTLIFDLDDTLYSPHSGLWTAIRIRIDQYMREKLGIPADSIPEIRETYFQRFGTTLRGLQAVYHVDTQDYLNFVHDIPLTDYIQPDHKLDNVLGQLPHRKLIFTNADRGHAQRVLAILGISHRFDMVIDILDIHPYCKPMPEAFDIALRKAGISDPARCLMLDDSQSNLKGAAAIGMGCIWVNPTISVNHSDCVRIENLYGLVDLLSQT
jgi:putative hydrolase of the HAD superfamily